jgi:hypothetical protein
LKQCYPFFWGPVLGVYLSSPQFLLWPFYRMKLDAELLSTRMSSSPSMLRLPWITWTTLPSSQR